MLKKQHEKWKIGDLIDNEKTIRIMNDFLIIDPSNMLIYLLNMSVYFEILLKKTFNVYSFDI